MSEYPPDWNSRRKEVYRRDNYRCQNCSAKGGRIGNAELHAHHITPKSEGGSHSPLNLKTLCKDCHNDVHSSMNTATSSSRGSASSASEPPDSDLLKSVYAHITVAGAMFVILFPFIVCGIYLGYRYPFISPEWSFMSPVILTGIFTMIRAKSDDESMRIGTWLLGLIYLGSALWFIA